ncbi:hypothetical protein F4824DRAFT_355241 [Ustulina deusta]|nr:hypothetical protein F4824DRAFT_355241 [Ustulina deusta]
MVADLYNHGVDAHSGIFIHNPLPILEENPQSNSAPPSQVQFQYYQSHIHEYENQWPSQAGEGEEDCRKNLGRSIGVACHKRIRVRNPHDQRQDISENLLDRLRRYSFMPLSDHTPECIRRDRPAELSWTERPQEGNRGRKRSSRELLQQILDRSSPPSVNSSGSKSASWALNIARSQDPKRQGELEGVSCSEDTTPHICVDEQRTNQSSL